MGYVLKFLVLLQTRGEANGILWGGVVKLEGVKSAGYLLKWWTRTDAAMMLVSTPLRSKRPSMMGPCIKDVGGFETWKARECGKSPTRPFEWVACSHIRTMIIMRGSFRGFVTIGLAPTLLNLLVRIAGGPYSTDCVPRLDSLIFGVEPFHG